MHVKINKNEAWWGIFSDRGHEMPYGSTSNVSIPMSATDSGTFFMVSNQGRYIYDDIQHDIEIKNGVISFDGTAELADGFGNLRNAYRAAAGRHFLSDGKIPNERFFTSVQYNTWIELMYNQNQTDILNYAHSIVDNGMKPGILMIDEGWADDYGIFEFSRAKFENPRAMTDELHALGFKVMLWVVPLISPDSNTFRELRNTDILLRDKDGEIAVRKWWNGYSAVLDLSCKNAVEWFCAKLDECMNRFGADGFKFDSGDSYLYREDDRAAKGGKPLYFTGLYNKLGERYEYNEFRAAWNVRGNACVCRLQDKAPSWGTDGLSALIPDMLAQGLVGSFFGCPDMIGGGAYGNFLNGYKTDEELYIRWLEASALMPMMQFSIAPWRILSPENMKIVKKYAALHEQYGDYFVRLAKTAAQTHEPIMRSLEYMFPGEGFECTNDCFMLGEKLLVAPVLEKGKRERTLVLPRGKWKHCGKLLDGGREHTVAAELDFLPVFERAEERN